MNASARVYETRVTHVRRSPWRRSFAHRSWMWVVDIDRIAGDRRSRFRAEDHLDGRKGTLRESLQRFAEKQGVALGDGAVLLAAQPRVLWFCFNPISVWWSLDRSGDLAATVVEVHNTYGDRHAYLLPAALHGRVVVDKAMYVSPFHGVDGNYEVVAPIPGDHLNLSVSLRTGSGARFTASLTGRRIDSPPWWSVLATCRDALRIRIHGITLWARRLPIHSRPIHHQEALK